MKKFLKIILYQTYLLQFEDYDFKRFFSSIKEMLSGGVKMKSGKKIRWTMKIILLFKLSVILEIFFASLISFFIFSAIVWQIIFSVIFSAVVFFVFSPLFFLFLLISNALFFPFDFVFKKIIIFAARMKIRRYRKNLKIIGITGSFGKTTMKEAISVVLATKFNILKTEGNQNTTLGISKLILKKLNKNTQIFVVEMAAYSVGDIRKICKFVSGTDISVLTGINESHFERFKNINNTIKTKFEIVEGCNNGLIVLNGDNDYVVQNFEKYASKKNAIFYGRNRKLSKYWTGKVEFDENGLNLSFKLWKGDREIGFFKLPFLSEYIVNIIMACFIVCGRMRMSEKEIIDGVNQLKPAEHRFQPIRARNDILIIDDSYNGNPDGVSQAILTLAKFKNRRKIYITPGLAEVGAKEEELHFNIGKKLSGVADLVILEDNKACAYIKRGLIKNDFPEKYIMVFDSIYEAHKEIADGKILKENDVALFQRGRSQFLFNLIEAFRR